MLLITYFYVDA